MVTIFQMILCLMDGNECYWRERSFFKTKNWKNLPTSTMAQEQLNRRAFMAIEYNVLNSLVGFYGISTVVDYLMPNPLYLHILNIYDLVWLGFMAYQPFNAKSSLYIL